VSRKPKISTDAAPVLSSNPFAGLGGVLGELPAGEPIADPPKKAGEPAEVSPPLLRGKIVVRREKKGRGGKTATIIEGLRVPAETLDEMARTLRRKLGCGAHVEGVTIVVTGAQTERVRSWLEGQGASRIVIGN